MCAKEIVSFELKRHVYNATVKLVYHFTFQYFLEVEYPYFRPSTTQTKEKSNYNHNCLTEKVIYVFTCGEGYMWIS